MVITLKDGSKIEYAEPMSAYDIARDISDALSLAAEISFSFTKAASFLFKLIVFYHPFSINARASGLWKY